MPGDIGVWSVSDLLMFARISSVEYMADDKAAVTALGMRYVGRVGNSQVQATVAHWGGYTITAIRGTQVGNGQTSIPELFDDVENDVLALPGGLRVHKGFWEPLADIWGQIDALGCVGQPLTIGHSLGGVRAHLSKHLRPESEVVSFGAPKGADDAFWRAAFPEYPPLRVVHDDDVIPGWPWDGPFTQPADVAWLHGGALKLVPKRPGWNVSVMAHFIDTGYIAALEALAR